MKGYKIKRQNDEKYQKKYMAFYNSKAWRNLSKRYALSKNYICEECRKKGILKKGTQVHHIVPIDQDWDKRLDWDNLQLLCTECHNEKHKSRMSAMQKFKKDMEELENGKASSNN